MGLNFQKVLKAQLLQAAGTGRTSDNNYGQQKLMVIDFRFRH
jgi:hypothetical protein